MPKLKSPADVCKSIITKQLRYIDKKAPAEVSPIDIKLVIDYYKTLTAPSEDDDQSALSELDTEELLKALNEAE